MDFGLLRFTSSLKEIEQWSVPDKVRMLLICPYTLEDPEPFEYFHTTHHNVAGGLVTGSGEKILEMIGLFRQELETMLNQLCWCQLDEAIMATIVRKHPHLVDFYYGDYSGIISNYEMIRDMKNVSQIIQTYLNKRQYHEAQRVLNRIDYWSSSQALEIYVNYSILTNYYVLRGQLHPAILRLKDHPQYHEQVMAVINRNRDNIKFYSNFSS
jgi:hypothetical protein